MYVVTLSVFHNLAIWLLYVNKPEPKVRRLIIYHLANKVYIVNDENVDLEIGAGCFP